MDQLKKRVDNITRELKTQQESESFVETDIDRWTQDLRRIQVELSQPPPIFKNLPQLQTQDVNWNSIIRISTRHESFAEPVESSYEQNYLSTFHVVVIVYWTFLQGILWGWVGVRMRMRVAINLRNLLTHYSKSVWCMFFYRGYIALLCDRTFIWVSPGSSLIFTETIISRLPALPWSQIRWDLCLSFHEDEFVSNERPHRIRFLYRAQFEFFRNRKLETCMSPLKVEFNWKYFFKWNRYFNRSSHVQGLHPYYERDSLRVFALTLTLLWVGTWNFSWSKVSAEFNFQVWHVCTEQLPFDIM